MRRRRDDWIAPWQPGGPPSLSPEALHTLQLAGPWAARDEKAPRRQHPVVAERKRCVEVVVHAGGIPR